MKRKSIDPLEIKGNSSSAWNLVREYLIQESENKCQVCRDKFDILHIHHLDGKGLNNKRKNLLVVCQSCHGLLHQAKLNTGDRIKLADWLKHR